MEFLLVTHTQILMPIKIEGFFENKLRPNQHNVSKKYLASLHSKQQTAAASTRAGPRVARGDSSSSLPVRRKSSSQEEEVRDQARRRSLPRVTRLGGDVMLVEQSKQSREIFI